MQAAPGHLDKRSLTALEVPANAAAYICGPNAFMTAITDALAAIGVAPDRIHSELFGALRAAQPRHRQCRYPGRRICRRGRQGPGRW